MSSSQVQTQLAGRSDFNLFKVFTGDLYSPHYPKRGLAGFLWRRRVWVECTFGLCTMEPWEKQLVLFMWLIMTAMFFTSTFHWLNHLDFIQRRTTYYFVGHEGDMREMVRQVGKRWVANSSEL